MISVWSRGSAASGFAVLVALAAGGAGTVQPTAEAVTTLTPQADGYGFAITAPEVTDLYPGATRTVPLTLVNPHPFDLLVTAVTGSLSWTSDPRCQALPTNLTIGGYQGELPFVVPAHASRSTGSVPITMPATAANPCQRVDFVVYLRGSATKVQQ